MRDLTILKSFNTLSKVTEILESDQTDDGVTFLIKSDDLDIVTIFIPKDKMHLLEEHLISFYVQHKMWNLHNKAREEDLLILLKNYQKYEDLIYFNPLDRTYTYSSLIELNKVPEFYSSSIKNWIIELNLDLIKMKYNLK